MALTRYTTSCQIHFERKLLLQGLINPEATQQEKADWDHVAKRISDSSYTAFVSSSELGANGKYLNEGWFEEALDRSRVIEEAGGVSEFYEYALGKDKDEFPVGMVHWGIMLGHLHVRISVSCPTGDEDASPVRIS